MNLNFNIEKIEIFNKISGRDKAFLARQLSTMLASGLPINKSVGILIAQERNPKLKKILVDVQKDLEAGLAFSASIAKHPEVFDRVFINIAISGEAIGNLSQVLEQLADQMERSVDFNSKVRGAFAYPAFIVAVMVIVGFIMMIFVVPQLQTIFDDSGVELPFATRIVVAMSGFLSSYWYLVIIGFVALAIGIWTYFRSKAGERVFDKVKVHLPSSLGYDIYMARLARTLGMLIEGGTPIIEALDVTSTVMNNVYYKDLLQKSIEEIKKGTPLSATLGQTSLVPALVYQMVAVGEQTGQLDQILNRLAIYYEDAVDTKLKNIVALVEPIIIVTIGIAVGFLVYSIIVPIYNIAQF